MKRKSSDVSGVRGGIGLFGAAALMFTGLKLAGVIAWPWWQVLAPLWGPVALMLLAVGVMGVLGGVIGYLEDKKAVRK